MIPRMSTVQPNKAVLNLIQNASDRVLIAAPYIKSTVISQLIDELPKTVSEFICVTRWNPVDIASGSCDIEIYDDISKISGGQLFVFPHLHAKYFSNGKTALVGSANLTSRGLGWCTPSNFELLVELPVDFPGLDLWESKLMGSAIPATEQIRDQILAQSESMVPSTGVQHLPEVGIIEGELSDFSTWIPTCSVPERLWEVYEGRGTNNMVSSAYNSAKDDLAALEPPTGLTEELFVVYIRGILWQMPVISEIDEQTKVGLADEYALGVLENYVGEISDEELNNAWQIVKRWIMYFFPNTYRTESRQQILVRGREIMRK